MRRHLLVLTLLASLPIEAQADRAFCEGLQGLVNAAQSRFDWLPTTGRNIPGSIRERRGVEENSSGPHGVYYAVMYSHNGPSAEAQQHFERAVRMDPEQHEFHFALAQALVGLGHYEAGARALAAAREHSGNQALRQAYAGKLQRLREQLTH